jgi:Domain of unknown function (DUF5619)
LHIEKLGTNRFSASEYTRSGVFYPLVQSISDHIDYQLSSARHDRQSELRVTATPGLSRVPVARLGHHCRDFEDALKQAGDEARRLGEHMLLSWCDRDFESPQHSSECHADSAVPGYVDYGVNHGATLMVDIENGRFVFFYFPVDP